MIETTLAIHALESAFKHISELCHRLYVHTYACTHVCTYIHSSVFVHIIYVYKCFAVRTGVSRACISFARVDESAVMQYDFSIGWRIQDQVSLNYKNTSYCYLLRFWYKMLMKKNRAKFFSKTLFIVFSVGIFSFVSLVMEANRHLQSPMIYC